MKNRITITQEIEHDTVTNQYTVISTKVIPSAGVVRKERFLTRSDVNHNIICLGKDFAQQCRWKTNEKLTVLFVNGTEKEQFQVKTHSSINGRIDSLPFLSMFQPQFVLVCEYDLDSKVLTIRPRV